VITVQWQGQQWDDNTAPWVDRERTEADPLVALQLMGSVVFYENTRPVGWSSSTADDADYIRGALAKRPYMSGFVQTDWQGAVQGERV